jgi:hypothetical protein
MALLLPEAAQVAYKRESLAGAFDPNGDPRPSQFLEASSFHSAVTLLTNGLLHFANGPVKMTGRRFSMPHSMGASLAL